MSTEILHVAKVGNDLQITVSDPSRTVTAVPGIVYISDINFSGLVLNPVKARISSALGTYLQIRSFSRYADLQRIRVTPNMSQEDMDIFVNQFESARLNRLTNSSNDGSGSGENNPPPIAEGDQPSPDYTSVLSGKSFSFEPWHILVLLVGAYVVYKVFK